MMTYLSDGQAKRMLHVAPEPCLEKALRKRLQSGYLTADLYNPPAMVKMDITDIQYSDETFDVICCSHVLEHVPDDMSAPGEMHRVLKPQGWAVVLVPITADETFEDTSVTGPESVLEFSVRKTMYAGTGQTLRTGSRKLDSISRSYFPRIF